MNLYVAAKFEDRKRARKVMRLLESHGHVITYDWTHAKQFSLVQAARDMRGVQDAQAFVFVAEKKLAYKGAYVEMGIALTSGLPIYVMGRGIDKCIFTKLPQVHRGIAPLLK